MKTADPVQSSLVNDVVDTPERYRNLVHLVEAILWEADAQTFATLFVNPYVQQVLGYPSGAWAQDATFWQDHIHLDDQVWVLDYYRQAIADQQPFTLEYRMVALNGRSIWLRDSVTIQVEEGHPTRLYSIKLDITTQKQTESLLNRQNMLLHMMNSTPRDVALYESERMARERAEVLREFAHIVSSSLDPRNVLRRSLHELRRVLVFDSASIYLNSRGENGEFMAGIGFYDVELTTYEAQRLLKTSPILGRMSQDLKSILCPDVRYLKDWIWVAGAEQVRSFMGAPLISYDGAMIGVLMVDSNHIGFFHEADLQMVEVLAQHLSTSIENAWLFEQSQKQLAEKTALLEASTAVSSSLDLITVLTRVAEQMIKAIGLTSVYILDWIPETALSTVLADYYSPEASPAEKISDLGVTYNLIDDFGLKYDQMIRHTWSVFQLDDPNTDEKTKKHMRQYGAKSVLLIPLVVKDRVIGHADLWESRYRREFTTAEIEWAQGIASQAAIAMSNAQLFQAEARRRREAEILKEVAGFITSTLELDEVLNRVVEAVHRYLSGIQNCAISILENNGKFLRTRVSWFDAPNHSLVDVGEGSLVANTVQSRLALESRNPVVISDIQTLSIDDPRHHWALTKGLRSLLYIPLVIHNEPIGLLHINGWQPHVFSPEELAFCQGVATQAAVAIQNAHLFAAERRQLQLSRTLQQVGAILTTSLRLDEVYNLLFDLLAQVIEYDSVSIHLLNETAGTLQLVAGRGFLPGELETIDLEHIKPVLLTRVAEPPYWAVIRSTTTNPEWLSTPYSNYVNSWIGAALMVKGRLMGVLNLDSRTADIYNETMAEMVAVFANQAAVAIENARLYDEIRRRANELEILHQVALATAVTMDVDKLLLQTTEMIVASLYSNVFGFVLVDEESGKLITHFAYHGIPEWLYAISVPIDGSVVGTVVKSGELCIIPDVSQETIYYPGNPTSRSEIAVPIKIGSKVVGVINVESPQLRAFNDRDAHFLTTLAGQVAGAIERARLYEVLRRQADRLAQQVAQRTAELQNERDRTLTILESAGEGIVLTDTEPHILYINPAMEQISGYSRAELIHLNPRILGSGQTPKPTYQEMWHTLLKGERWSGEIINRRKDGTLWDVALTVTPIRDKDSQITGYVSVQSDISHLKELDRLKTRFVSNVSHELRTPLTNIKTYITLLERGREEKRSRYLQVLNQETDRLTRLIQDLLNISRLDAEPFKEQIEASEPRQLIQNVYDTFTAKAEARQIHFQQITPAYLPPVYIERHHLEQLIVNLLGNAFAYTSKGGHIAIKAGISGEQSVMVWICVEDSGAGISQEDIPRLFDRFFRGQTAVDSGISGTGLGLAICKEIVDRYKGKIEVESTPGRGSRFTIWLPVAK